MSRQHQHKETKLFDVLKTCNNSIAALHPLSEAQLDIVVANLDSSGDGLVSFQELLDRAFGARHRITLFSR
eukprot:SAG31_NODE_6501_length_1994_cov_1.790501_2_plen_71_part_00